jgi:hypothetical protein
MAHSGMAFVTSFKVDHFITIILMFVAESVIEWTVTYLAHLVSKVELKI